MEPAAPSRVEGRAEDFMRKLTLIASALLALAAGCSDPEEDKMTDETERPAPKSWVTIASYLGGDTATEERIAALFGAAGIKYTAFGSLGYSVAVAAGDEVRARGLISEAVVREGLAVTLIP
jgi:hypothetical protein